MKHEMTNVEKLIIKFLSSREQLFSEGLLSPLLVISNLLHFFWKCCRQVDTQHTYTNPAPLKNPYVYLY